MKERKSRKQGKKFSFQRIISSVLHHFHYFSTFASIFLRDATWRSHESLNSIRRESFNETKNEQLSTRKETKSTASEAAAAAQLTTAKGSASGRSENETARVHHRASEDCRRKIVFRTLSEMEEAKRISRPLSLRHSEAVHFRSAPLSPNNFSILNVEHFIWKTPFPLFCNSFGCCRHRWNYNNCTATAIARGTELARPPAAGRFGAAEVCNPRAKLK